MEKTLPEKSKTSFVEKVIGVQAYQSQLQLVKSSKIFGAPMTSLSQEDLQVIARIFQSALYDLQADIKLISVKTAGCQELVRHILVATEGAVIAKENPFKPGDWVRLKHGLRDAYQEEWHSEGDVMQVESIAKDGEGLMFSSQLGIHFSNVEPASPPNK